MRYERLFRHILFFAAVAGITFIVFFMLDHVYLDARALFVPDAEKGWELEVRYPDREVYRNVDLSGFSPAQSLDRGDELLLKKRFTFDEVNGGILRIYIRQSAVRVSLNGEEIYSYGFDRYDDGRFVGTGYHFVVLPQTDPEDSSELAIEFLCCENGGITSLPMVWLTPQETAYTAFMGGQVATVSASVFLFMLGTIVSVITIWYLSLDREYLPLVMVGFISLFVGLWSMLSCGMLRIFDIDISFNNFLEYMIMYISLIPILILGRYQRRDQDGPRKRMTVAIAGISVFGVTCVLLHIADIIHIVHFNIIFDVLVAVLFMLLMFDDRSDYGDLTRSDRMFRAAMIVAALFIFADIARFQLSLHLFRSSQVLGISILPFGTLVFVILLLYAYLSLMFSRRMDMAEKETLKTLAYSDQMTGLSNRARSSVVFGELDRGHGQYAILNFDLNGLKRINDSHGHSAGDTLISTFAAILRDSFRETGEAIRMSGDEFIVVVRDRENIDRIDSAIEELKRQQAEESRRLSIEVDASYGIARSSEMKSPMAEQIYAMADERMYRMKVESKKGRIS